MGFSWSYCESVYQRLTADEKWEHPEAGTMEIFFEDINENMFDLENPFEFGKTVLVLTQQDFRGLASGHYAWMEGFTKCQNY